MNKKKMILIGTIAILLMLLFFLISLRDKQRKIYSDEIVEWDGRIFVQLEQGTFSEEAKKNLATVNEKNNTFNGFDYKYQDTGFYSKIYDNLESLKSDLDMDIVDYSSDGGYLLEINDSLEQAVVTFSDGEISGCKRQVMMYVYCETTEDGNRWTYSSSDLGEDVKEISLDDNRKYYIGENATVYLNRQGNILYFMKLSSIDEDVVQKAYKYFYGE